MANNYLIVFILTALFCFMDCCDADESKIENTEEQNVSLALDQEAIMNMCNETFRTSMDFLIELNTTGTFPDESDKTPMCYIRCYLGQVGILNEDELNIEKAMEMAWSTTVEALDECNKETADRINPCEKAYFLTRCVMMRNIVDSRVTD